MQMVLTSTNVAILCTVTPNNMGKKKTTKSQTCPKLYRIYRNTICMKSKFLSFQVFLQCLVIHPRLWWTWAVETLRPWNHTIHTITHRHYMVCYGGQFKICLHMQNTTVLFMYAMVYYIFAYYIYIYIYIM